MVWCKMLIVLLSEYCMLKFPVAMLPIGAFDIIGEKMNPCSTRVHLNALKLQDCLDYHDYRSHQSISFEKDNVMFVLKY